MVDFEFLQYKGEYFPFELSLYSGGYRDCIPIKGKCPDSVYRSQIGYTGQCHIPGAYKYGSEYKWPGLSLDSVLSLLSHLSNTFLFVFKDGAAERRILKGFDYHSVDLHPHLINVSMRKLRDATSVNYGIHSMHSGIGDM